MSTLNPPPPPKKKEKKKRKIIYTVNKNNIINQNMRLINIVDKNLPDGIRRRRT